MSTLRSLPRTLAASAAANAGASAMLVTRNLLDGYWAARLSAEALAALTLAAPVSLLLIGLSQGVSVSASNRLALKARQDGQHGALVFHAMLTALLCGCAAAVMAWLLGPLWALGMGGQGDAGRRAAALSMALAGGAPLLFLYGVLTACLRSLGHAAGAARATIRGLGGGTACTAALMLAPLPAMDPVLTIPLGLALGYGLAAALALLELQRAGVRMAPGSMRQCAPDVSEILRGAGPVAANGLIGLGGMFAVVAIVAGTGVETTAAFGAVYRIEQFGLVVLNAIVLAMVPLAARNIDDPGKLRQIVGTAWSMQLVAGVTIGGALLLAASSVGRLFGLSDEPAALAAYWLGFLALALTFQGVTLSCISLLQIRRARLALALNCLRLYGCLLPLLWLYVERDGRALYPLMCLVHVAAGGALALSLWWWNRRAACGRAADATA